MTTLTWLHLCDLHLRTSLVYDADIVLKALLQDVAKRIEQDGLRPDFIAVTGDIAFSGQAEEYELARQFFDDLMTTTSLNKDRLFLVPGNHDVNRKRISRGAQGIADSLTDRQAVNAILETPADRELMFARLAGYAQFVGDYLGQKRTFNDDGYCYVRAFEVSGQQIALLGLNSAWLAQGGTEDYGKLALGERQVRRALAEAEGTDLKIALLHHPFDWLRDFDRHGCQALLTQECHFVLHGHLHRSDMTLEQSLDTRTMVIAAGASYETREQVNNYNFVRLDLDKERGQIFLRTFSDQQGGFWTKDVLTYRDAPDGVYTFPLRLDWSPPVEELPASVSVPDRVYVRNLTLANFRCFEDQLFPLSEEFTVFIGDNASGKSTLLEALVIGVGSFLLGLDEPDTPSIETDQARLVRYKHGKEITYESQYPVRVVCQAMWGNRELEWAHVRRGVSQQITDQEADDITDLARRLKAQVRQGRDVVLPLIAYYSTGRVWRAPEIKSSDTDEAGSRFRGYDNCLDPASHVQGLMQWMKTQELIALSEEQPNEVLDAVKDAIKNCVEGLEDVSYNVREDDLYACFGDGQEFPFRMLSEGVRNMLAMVADIAQRAVLLNPQFGEKAAALTPGIVLIDELDLHLHPKWQQRVVADLRRTFPLMQFIATTHSPLIVGGLSPEQIILLREANYVPMEEPLQGLRADQILTSPAFGLESSRDPETQDLIETYSRLAVRDDLTPAEQDILKDAAQQLQIRLPSAAERQEARQAYGMIQKALLAQWEDTPPEQKEKLAKEVQAQLLEAVSGQRRPE